MTWHSQTVSVQSRSRQTIRHRLVDVLARSGQWVWRVLPHRVARSVEHLVRFWCALQLESRSFLGRMNTRLSRKHWGVSLGPIYRVSPEGHLVFDARTAARSEGTRILESVRPWASTTEVEIYLEGFHAGEQFVLGSLDIQSRALFESTLMCTSIGSGNSMPLPTVQQSTKRDRSTPLPSRV